MAPRNTRCAALPMREDAWHVMALAILAPACKRIGTASRTIGLPLSRVAPDTDMAEKSRSIRSSGSNPARCMALA